MKNAVRTSHTDARTGEESLEADLCRAKVDTCEPAARDPQSATPAIVGDQRTGVKRSDTATNRRRELFLTWSPATQCERYSCSFSSPPRTPKYVVVSPDVC